MRAKSSVKSSTRASLGNLSVVVTRPAEQAGELAALVERFGGRPVVFPTIIIAARPCDDRMVRQFKRLATADWVIFISTHAVRHGLECGGIAGASLDCTRIVSIGGATTGALRAAGKSVALESPSPPCSESLLSTPEMCNVAGKKIFIIRGTGGRELLGRMLLQRGADVEYIECYERRCPKGSIGPVLDAVDGHQGAIIVTTSVNGLQNLMGMAADQAAESILDARLLVAGERQVEEAWRLGWRGKVTAAPDAGNAAVLEKLLELATKASGPV